MAAKQDDGMGGAMGVAVSGGSGSGGILMGSGGGLDGGNGLLDSGAGAAANASAAAAAAAAATTPRLLWNPDNVRDVAESVGIAQLGDEALRCLSQDVEFRIGQVIVEALRCMRAARRTTLTVQDVALALRVLDVEPLYGYESTRPLRYGEASLGPGQPLFYVEDEEVEFERLINAPLPRVPRDASLTAHWLAIEGVQPAIPQNPTTAEARRAAAAAAQQDLVLSAGKATGSGVARPGGAGTTAANTASVAASAAAGGGSGAGASLGAGAAAAAATTGGDPNHAVGLKPAVKHILSNELVLYFDKIQAAVLDDNPDEEVLRLRAAALTSVRADPGLHQLVPYFVSFIATQVTHRLDDLAVLRRMLDLTTALVENPNVFLDPYITPLCAPILTCLLGQKIGGSSSSGGVGGPSHRQEDDDPDAASASSTAATAAATISSPLYALRELAASLLGLLARKYARTNALLRPKLTRTCLKTLLVSSSTASAASATTTAAAAAAAATAPSTHHRPAGVLFGAVAGLSAAGGPEAVRVLLLPNLKMLDAYVLQGLQERARAAIAAGGAASAAVVDLEMLVEGGLVKAIRTLSPGTVADESTATTAVSPLVLGGGSGNNSNSETETAELVDFLGPIVGSRVAQLGDRRLNAVILEARNIE